MIVRYLSTYLGILQFPTVMFCGVEYFTPIKFISSHFIHLGAIVQWIVSLISFSDCLLLMRRKANGFDMFIFYKLMSFANILNLLIKRSKFSWVICSFLHIGLYYLQIEMISFGNSQLLWFIYFSCIIALVRISTSILKRVMRAGNFILFLS